MAWVKFQLDVSGTLKKRFAQPSGRDIKNTTQSRIPLVFLGLTYIFSQKLFSELMCQLHIETSPKPDCLVDVVGGVSG